MRWNYSHDNPERYAYRGADDKEDHAAHEVGRLSQALPTARRSRGLRLYRAQILWYDHGRVAVRTFDRGGAEGFGLDGRAAVWAGEGFHLSFRFKSPNASGQRESR